MISGLQSHIQLRKSLIMIVKTPVRVSLFGGGSDFPNFFNENKARVVGFTIDKFINNIAIPTVYDLGYKIRLSYRLNEEVLSISDISHPLYKQILSRYPPNGSWHFLSVTDIPAGTGLGSSSSFTVGLLRLIKKINRLDYEDNYSIGKEAIDFERNILRESGGWQDQIHAAYGGINSIDFFNNDFSVQPIKLSKISKEHLNSSMYLVYSGKTRKASIVEKSKNNITKDDFLRKMVEIAIEGEELLRKDKLDLKDIGKLLIEGWKLKKSLSASVTNLELDDLYETIIQSGAFGAKLCGAGGGGFFFVLSNQESIKKLKDTLEKDVHITKISLAFNTKENIRDSL